MRRLVILAVVVATASCERAQPPPAPPVLAAVAPPAKPEPRPAADDDTSSESGLPKQLPRHGYVVSGGGLGGYSSIVIDYDARTLRYRSVSYLDGRGKVDQSFSINEGTVARLHLLAVIAEREQPNGAMPEIYDVGQRFYAIDGDHHVDVSGTLFDATGLGHAVAWRPMAARVFDETFALAQSLGVKP
jgi:hypothetical protein